MPVHGGVRWLTFGDARAAHVDTVRAPARTVAFWGMRYLGNGLGVCEARGAGGARGGQARGRAHLGGCYRSGYVIAIE